ncbi:hypothetical protein ED733_008262 [Metarhizium rileyi]|uniref:Yeast cell wall synthesis Kre9/Knh1-like N-terminal domain-containing protein n=1 Tax=Metarhizium rileyi (strain RCEF 4871) TaxID=1649241 RepID=A0A5C6GKF4_METRR|nr:hypothetical protein ED733_008262 [Metarhizium rileyi]
MRVSAATVLAFAATAIAQLANFDVVSNPGLGESVPAGSTYTIRWQNSVAEYNGETIKIELLGGPSNITLSPIGEVATGVQNSQASFDWLVQPQSDHAVYGLRLSLEKNADVFQYSFPFTIAGSAKKEEPASPSGNVIKTESQAVNTATASSIKSGSTITASAGAVQTLTAICLPCSASLAASGIVKQNSTTLARASASQPADVKPTEKPADVKPATAPSAAVAAPGTGAKNRTTTAVPAPNAAANAFQVSSLTILGVVAAVLAL